MIVIKISQSFCFIYTLSSLYRYVYSVYSKKLDINKLNIVVLNNIVVILNSLISEIFHREEFLITKKRHYV